MLVLRCTKGPTEGHYHTVSNCSRKAFLGFPSTRYCCEISLTLHTNIHTGGVHMCVHVNMYVCPNEYDHALSACQRL